MELIHTRNTEILRLAAKPVASALAPISVIPHRSRLRTLILLLLRAPAIAVMPSSPISFSPREISCKKAFACRMSPIQLAPA